MAIAVYTYTSMVSITPRHCTSSSITARHARPVMSELHQSSPSVPLKPSFLLLLHLHLHPSGVKYNGPRLFFVRDFSPSAKVKRETSSLANASIFHSLIERIPLLKQDARRNVKEIHIHNIEMYNRNSYYVYTYVCTQTVYITSRKYRNCIVSVQ